MIDSLKIQNFTAFEALEIKFSPGINVLIGENNTGKTHLLKLAYVCCSVDKFVKDQPEPNQEGLERFLSDRLVRVFLPAGNRLGSLYHQGGRGPAEVTAILEPGRKFRFSFNSDTNFVSIKDSGQRYFETQDRIPAFIPTKEVLSFMEGMASLYDRYNLAFDETYRDLFSSLNLPTIRSETMQAEIREIIEAIEAIYNGKFIFYEGGRVTFKTQDVEYSSNAVAEGFRKLGILVQLLKTGVIEPRRSGPLFWDEPEGNMNPQLMRLLVDTLLVLARRGQQVIVSTHDYVFLKWLELLIVDDDQVRYHSLFRDNDNHRILLKSTDNYLDIDPNPMDETFEALINADLDLGMGDLGR